MQEAFNQLLMVINQLQQQQHLLKQEVSGVGVWVWVGVGAGGLQPTTEGDQSITITATPTKTRGEWCSVGVQWQIQDYGGGQIFFRQSRRCIKVESCKGSEL